MLNRLVSFDDGLLDELADYCWERRLERAMMLSRYR